MVVSTTYYLLLVTEFLGQVLQALLQVTIPVCLVASVPSAQQIVPVQGKLALIVSILRRDDRSVGRVDIRSGVRAVLVVVATTDRHEVVVDLLWVAGFGSLEESCQCRDLARCGSLHGKPGVNGTRVNGCSHRLVVLVHIISHRFDTGELGKVVLGEECARHDDKWTLDLSREAPHAELRHQGGDRRERLSDLVQRCVIGCAARRR